MTEVLTEQPAPPEPPAEQDPRVDKRRVTMRSVVALSDGETAEHKATDYVRPDFLDAYVAAARKVWQSVEVSNEPDAGPGGYHGQTHVPAHLDHPLAGQTFPATEDDRYVEIGVER